MGYVWNTKEVFIDAFEILAFLNFLELLVSKLFDNLLFNFPKYETPTMSPKKKTSLLTYLILGPYQFLQKGTSGRSVQRLRILSGRGQMRTP